KTDAGERVIPLNEDAIAALMDLYHRAEALGGTNPGHFVFPACENGKIDPTRSQQSWRTAWRNLTRAAGLAGLRFHDLRHHAITELAESEASDQTIMAIAGHVSPKMLAHYSHVRLGAKRDALDALTKPSVHAGDSNGRGRRNSRSEERGYVTNNDANQPDAESIPAEPIERNGR